MMKAVAEAKLINAAEFRGWPVFATVRSEAAFAAEFELVFGEKRFIEADAVGGLGVVEIEEPGE